MMEYVLIARKKAYLVKGVKVWCDGIVLLLLNAHALLVE